MHESEEHSLQHAVLKICVAQASLRLDSVCSATSRLTLQTCRQWTLCVSAYWRVRAPNTSQSVCASTAWPRTLEAPALDVTTCLSWSSCSSASQVLAKSMLTAWQLMLMPPTCTPPARPSNQSPQGNQAPRGPSAFDFGQVEAKHNVGYIGCQSYRIAAYGIDRSSRSGSRSPEPSMLWRKPVSVSSARVPCRSLWYAKHLSNFVKHFK